MEHKHTDECLKYAASTGKPFCIVECTDSRRQYNELPMSQAEVEQCRQAILSDNFAYARLKPFCRVDRVLIYHRDPNSPSGFLLAAGGAPSVIDPMLREYRNTSALSPTER
jgi:hypothetical protein